MFSAQEVEYIKGLVNVYKELGYKYYVVHTVTDNTNNDLCFYFSNSEITAIADNYFKIDNALVLEIDSSSRNENSYNPSIHSRDNLLNNSYSGTLYVNEAEFIYSNATITYTITAFPINPDIMKSGTMNYENTFLSYISITLLCVIFLYNFVINIIRLRRT